ncbi:50S ribosomal protein L1 [Candidatus Methanoperedenaceae archaeon GB50]|nr:MAG: 50S ribosomal protein L1 [Candidatus Methanoperedenaceae archaeon GB50]CAD7773361.1 50S ribosomal protein L1 [Candidatus Methanoperedenaceae archaeon GB50]
MVSMEIVNAVRRALEDSPPRGFEESVDLAINLRDVDLTQPQNRIDEEVLLPHGRGRPVKVAVFGRGDVAQRAKNAGADYVFDEEGIKGLGEDPHLARNLANEVDFFISETVYMPLIGRMLGRVLGPRGKMPMPLTPDKDVTELVKRARSAIRVRSKDRPTFHVSIGRRKMDPVLLAENVESVITRIEQRLDRGRQNIRSVYVKTTMGPAVKVM